MGATPAGVTPGWNPGTPILALRDRLDRAVGWVTERRFWELWTAVIAMAIGVLLAVPDFTHLKKVTVWVYVIEHSQGPLVGPSPPESRNANLTFRFTPRIIGKVLQFSEPWHFAVLQILFGLLLLWLLARLVHEALGDRRLAVVTTVGSVGLWAVAASWTDFSGVFDGVAMALLLAAMVLRRLPLVLIAALAATFTDERALFALPLVALWHLWRDADGEAIGLTVERRPRQAQIAAVLVFSVGIAHIVIRQILKSRYGLSEGQNRSPGEPLAQLNNYPNGFWGALEGYWFLVGAGLISLAHLRRWWTVVIASGTVLTLFIIGVSVFDISRAVGYMFPVVGLALLGLRTVDRAWVRGMVWTAATVTLVWPMIYAADESTVIWKMPTPLQILHYVGIL